MKALTILFLLPIVVVAQWQMDITVDFGKPYTLTIGIDTLATDGFDRKLDKPAPPVPPEGFYCYFEAPEGKPPFNMLWQDIRPHRDKALWRIILKHAALKGTVRFSLGKIPYGTLWIDGLNGYKGDDGSFTLARGDSVIEIIYSLQRRWEPYAAWLDLPKESTVKIELFDSWDGSRWSYIKRIKAGEQILPFDYTHDTYFRGTLSGQISVDGKIIKEWVLPGTGSKLFR